MPAIRSHSSQRATHPAKPLRLLSLASLAALLCMPGLATAQPSPAPSTQTSGTAAPTATPDGYRQSLQQAQTLVQVCATDATQCVAARTSPDLLIRQKTAGTYAVHYGWLRATLEKARTATPADRAQAMAAAQARLSHELAFLNQPANPAAQARALSAAQAVLQHKQFQYANTGPSWWQLLLAHFANWLDHLFFLAAMASAHRPWIARLLEWSLLVGALAGLLAYVLQVLRRDRALSARWVGSRPLPANQPTVDWAARAHAAAAAADWREAIHAAYWAAIDRLARDGRWEQQPTGTTLRTPREYLRLLPPDTQPRASLARLTTLLERAWYAQRPTVEHDYTHACTLAANLGVTTLAPPAQGPRP